MTIEYLRVLNVKPLYRWRSVAMKGSSATGHTWYDNLVGRLGVIDCNSKGALGNT